ncbi:hypothetical protein IEQ34_020707 [Dendrobium chrysotoxum]|uniref:Uncharacterized protein n=1 Tax=Dendrobium chrysotoxum TaxID=161865 RepID=A0AAV7FKM3_DENCH|nr:hypothetical protein IEQ34_020707 [Dendrobium chrysotoxum]
MCHITRKPVIRRTELRTYLRSRPFRARPGPEDSEKATDAELHLRDTRTCGGTISSVSDSDSDSSNIRRVSAAGMLTGFVFSRRHATPVLRLLGLADRLPLI